MRFSVRGGLSMVTTKTPRTTFRSAPACAVFRFAGNLRAYFVICAISLSGPAIAAGERAVGSYTCAYNGSWGCAPPNSSGGICVESGRPHPRSFSLLLNFESKPFPRLRLNGLDGHLLRDSESGDYSVVWHLGGLGQPKFSITTDKHGRITATFRNEHQNGAYDSSTFKCSRLPRSIL
jgi:hypothetical protein